MTRISAKVSPLEIVELKKSKRRIANMPADERWIAVLRIRGTVDVREDVAETLKLLRLNKPHQLVIVPFNSSYKGMIIKVQRMIAWGEIDFDTFVKVLRKRGRVTGNKRLTDSIVNEMSKGKWASIEELAKAIWDRKISMKDLDWLKPVFRLNPPSGGYRGSVKKPFELGGSFGYWGNRINELIEKMI